ncbi:hypothetical protein LUZ60_016543 [Juncus effusus]|nr:hypothetical protein LUZ60_016543 [Juncus effusus]
MAKVLDALVETCKEKIQSVIGEKAVVVFGVREEFNNLLESMKWIQSTLTDAKRRRIEDSVSRTWIDELTDAMYEAEDIIDDFRSEFEKPSDDQASSSSFNQIVSNLNLLNPLSWFNTVRSRFDIADRIINLIKKINEISMKRQAYSVDPIKPNNQSFVNSRQTSSIIESDIVGKEIENASRKLVGMITSNHERKLHMVAIVGMGGIGKTTLAQKIFDNSLLKHIFQTRIWVCVSQEYSAIKLLQEIIRKIEPNAREAETISELHSQLSIAINGKKFFLVLDDMWQCVVWTDLLKKPLQFAASGVILLTTRDQNVAKGVDSRHVHEVQKLSRRASWELLCKKAYIEEEEEMIHLRDVGMEIVKKCDGLPLAIKVIGGLLAMKDKVRREWEKVLQSNAWFTDEIPEELHRALYISYEDLSPQLKECFLYCSLYPEDFIMLRDDLIVLWIAEGVIEEKKGELMEDTGEEYYNQLVRRGLLQPVRFLLGLIQFIDFESQCKMHDLVRSLAHYVSRGNLLYGDPELLSKNAISKLRHLSISKIGDAVMIPGKKTEHLRLRTLMVFYSRAPIVQDHLFQRLKNLRVLILNSERIQSISDSIGDLKHLRSLDLEFTSISKLPDSVSSFTNLQFLYLSCCKFLHVLPQGITQLSNLRRLGLVETPLTCVPKGIGKLRFLNNLEGFVVANEQCHGEMQTGWDLAELESLTQLKSLRLDKLENATIGTPILVGKCHLNSLQLSCTLQGDIQQPYSEEDSRKIEEIFEKLNPPHCLRYLIIWNFYGRRFPTWLVSTPNLTWLILVNCVTCVQLPPLGELLHLKCLRIRGARSVVSIGPEFFSTGINRGICFPKLELLLIEQMPNWEEWSLLYNVPEELMPSLAKIDIVNCPKLKALPEQLKHLTNLQELLIDGAHGLQAVKNLNSSFDWIYIRSRSCEEVSNIPNGKHLALIDCPAIRRVENLDALERVYVEDESMDHVPEWLLGLVNQQGNADMELVLRCNIRVLQRCLLGSPDWPIIERFSHVSISTKDNATTLLPLDHPFPCRIPNRNSKSPKSHHEQNPSSHCIFHHSTFSVRIFCPSPSKQSLRGLTGRAVNVIELRLISTNPRRIWNLPSSSETAKLFHQIRIICSILPPFFPFLSPYLILALATRYLCSASFLFSPPSSKNSSSLASTSSEGSRSRVGLDLSFSHAVLEARALSSMAYIGRFAADSYCKLNKTLHCSLIWSKLGF